MAIENDNENKELSVEFGDYWIYISNSLFHFSGSYTKSKNGKYILAWKDNLQLSDGDEMDENDDEAIQDDEKLDKDEEELYARYQEREFKEGFILLEDQKLILKDFFPRPHRGKVANNGTFILNSYIDRSNELKGRFVAYNKEGNELVNHLYSANLGGNGLSNDGRLAVCQTSHSNTSDDNTVTCFDLITGRLLWQRIPETRIADAFEFSSEENIIIFVYNNVGKFRYSITGELLDKERWYQARLKHGSGYELIEIANQKLATMGNSTNLIIAEEVLSLYLMAVKRMDSDYFLAKAHRKIGEIYELINKVDEAIIHYEQALKYNPKVGVIKRLQKLKQ